MNKLNVSLIALAATLALTAPAAAAQDPGPGLRAGAAVSDITPPIGTPMFAYTDRSRVFDPTNNADLLQVLADPDTGLYAKTFIASKGMHSRLTARSVVIERTVEASDGTLEEKTFALVQVDLGGIPFAVTKAVATRVASLGVTQDTLLISATHTHAGHGAIWPWEDNAAYGFVGGDIFDKRIFDLTVDGIVQSITRAHTRMREARIGVGKVDVAGASRNRAREAFDQNADKPATSHDPQLTVIRVDAKSGTDKPIAVWSNFAIHATSISDPILSGDNPGATSRIVEDMIGGGVVNVWSNGNQGDISPDGGPERVGDQPLQYSNSGFSGAHLAGYKVAKGVVAAWERAGENLSDDVDLEAKQSYMALDGTPADGEPVGPIPVLGASVVGGEQACAPIDGAAGPGQGKKMFLFGSLGIAPDRAPVSLWKVGDLGIVSTPSEVTWTAGKRIRDAVRAASGGELSDVITAGLTDAYLSYTATPEEYDTCGYEGGMTLFGRQQQGRYRDFAGGLSASMFAGGAAPAAAAEPAQTGFGIDHPIEPNESPKAGTAVDQPADAVKRYEQVTFRWNGGDRAVEAPRGRTFVRLQRRDDDGEWRTVATDDSYSDVVTREAGNVYVDRYRFGNCEPEGTYSFLVRGRHYADGAPVPYELRSESFELDALTLTSEAFSVSGGVASVHGLYPAPQGQLWLSLPRLVTTGKATFLADGEQVKGNYDATSGKFVAAVGEASDVSLLSIEDGCGNETA